MYIFIPEDTCTFSSSNIHIIILCYFNIDEVYIQISTVHRHSSIRENASPLHDSVANVRRAQRAFRNDTEITHQT